MKQSPFWLHDPEPDMKLCSSDELLRVLIVSDEEYAERERKRTRLEKSLLLLVVLVATLVVVVVCILITPATREMMYYEIGHSLAGCDRRANAKLLEVCQFRVELR